MCSSLLLFTDENDLRQRETQRMHAEALSWGNEHPLFLLFILQNGQQWQQSVPSPRLGFPRRPRSQHCSPPASFPTLSTHQKHIHLPPTSENCLHRSWLHWRWPLYLERAQTWLLWRWGCCRTHQNVVPHQTSSAWGTDLGQSQGGKASEETVFVQGQKSRQEALPTFW